MSTLPVLCLLSTLCVYFCLQCGVILIAREVLNTMDDDELGFLLAHEMSHIIMQHEVRQWRVRWGQGC